MFLDEYLPNSKMQNILDLRRQADHGGDWKMKTLP